MKKIFFLISLFFILFSCTKNIPETTTIKNAENVGNCGEVTNPLEQCKEKNHPPKEKQQDTQAQKKVEIPRGEVQKNTLTFLRSPKKIQKLGLFQDIPGDDFHTQFEEEKTDYYEIGSIMIGGKKSKIYLVKAKDIYVDSKFYFLKYSDSYFFLENISTDYFGEKIYGIENIFTKKVTKNIPKDIEEIFQKNLQVAKKIDFSKNNQHYQLILEHNKAEVFDSTNLEKIDFLDGEFYIEKRGNLTWGNEFYNKIKQKILEDYKVYEKLSKEEQKEYDKEERKVLLFSKKGIYKKLPDGTFGVYTLEIPFLSKKLDETGSEIYGNTVEVSANTGKIQLENYHDRGNESCGGEHSLDLNGKLSLYIKNPDPKGKNKTIDIKKIATYSENDLKIFGTNTLGQNIYTFKNPNHQLLQDLYKSYTYTNETYGRDTKKAPKNYNTFVKEVPIFFWKDPFGRMLAFIKYNTITDLESACGGKPVIYLYPEKKQKISVTLDWNKKNLISIPEYKNKWEVTAFPDGTIQSNGKNYPYLFWEDLLPLEKKDNGFVIKATSIPEFFDEKLSFLGLNEKEIEDFKNFWIPKMKEQKKEYYFIRFYDTEYLQKVAPIRIFPKPDSLQRVFMDYKGLENFKQVPKQQLKKFERKGFSVIEWGGNLQ